MEPRLKQSSRNANGAKKEKPANQNDGDDLNDIAQKALKDIRLDFKLAIKPMETKRKLGQKRTNHQSAKHKKQYGWETGDQFWNEKLKQKLDQEQKELNKSESEEKPFC